ncbi:MAG: JAB domain-containing protein [Sediminibacterium sp. Gen4]|jgi:DNA repair protein RadC|uniref:JAB domain-containing protein n=1 Tax=unclassified Sediminibacterium TaxID=2635961 RepID=UPI0015C05EDA|nr:MULTISPECIES: JAB domain-containing protein [unclassified Sediminibacterium]MBW0161798.1 JAB domain-containing protein [Sediminibacterium sp.]MBW0165003.1 JAB domain-containing protein [Sediminibacterium sp.]NWK64458.1 JAB domain-containing protein [Sediminibacterium sp. Gen4]
MKDLNNCVVAEIQISYKPAISDKPVIKSALDAYTIMRKYFNPETIAYKEQLVIMYLNNEGRVIGVYGLSEGGTKYTIVDIKIVFAIALNTASSAFIIAHNHPSGSLKPSQADIDLTNRLKEAAKFMDIRLLDHLIISPFGREFFSFENNEIT